MDEAIHPCQSWEGPLFSFSMFVWPYVYNVLTPSIDMYGWQPSQLWHRWIDGESSGPMSLGDMMSWGLCGVCPCPTPIWKFSPPPNEMSSLVSSLDNILHLHPTPIRDNLLVSFETCLHLNLRSVECFTKFERDVCIITIYICTRSSAYSGPSF